jgi:hypothetical protein
MTMPCTPFRDAAGNIVGIACSRGRLAAPCQEPGCTSPHVALCDYPLEGAAKGRTCDRRMCVRHRHRVGPNRDYCSTHRAMSAAGKTP